MTEAFGDGAQWNTDGGEYSLLPSASAPANFIYADSSSLYATDKVVYISPTIDGFSAAAGYEPNSNGLKEGYGNNTVRQLDQRRTSPLRATPATSASAARTPSTPPCSTA